jgi:ribosomal protein S18 acetylase RimI-like enzyme
MGLGTLLMKELVSHAEAEGVSKIRAEIMDTQKSAQAAFERLGFKKAAELKDFVTDLEGETHNLVVMVSDVSALWKRMENLLLEIDVRPERWA